MIFVLWIVIGFLKEEEIETLSDEIKNIDAKISQYKILLGRLVVRTTYNYIQLKEKSEKSNTLYEREEFLKGAKRTILKNNQIFQLYSKRIGDLETKREQVIIKETEKRLKELNYHGD